MNNPFSSESLSYLFFFFFKYGSNQGVTISEPEFERQCSSSRKGATVVIGGSGGYLEGLFGGISISANVLFSVHCPHILMVYYISQYTCWFSENIHAYSPADGVTRLTFHHAIVLVSKWGQTSQPKARTNKRRLYCRGHSAGFISFL